jgi:hypothetical protein
MADKKTNTSPLAVIDGKIASIKTRGVQLRKDAHECLVLIIDHYIAHGDFTRLMDNGGNDLITAIKSSLGNSIAQAAVQWVHEFVPSLKWNDTLRKFENVKGVTKEIIDVENYVLKSNGGPDGVDRKFTGNARDLPFFELERQTKVAPFDFMKSLQQFIARAERERDAALKANQPVPVNRAQLDALKGLADNIKNYKEEPAADADGETNVEPIPAAVAA